MAELRRFMANPIAVRILATNSERVNGPWDSSLAKRPAEIGGYRQAVQPNAVGEHLAAPAAAGFDQVPLAAAGSREWVELVLGDGTLVHVPPRQTAALDNDHSEQTVLDSSIVQAPQFDGFAGVLDIRH